MESMQIPPDLKRFADDVVARGRYCDLSDVVRAGLILLRQLEAERVDFISSLEEAEAEGRALGRLTIEEAEADIRSAIAAAKSAASRRPG